MCSETLQQLSAKGEDSPPARARIPAFSQVQRRKCNGQQKLFLQACYCISIAAVKQVDLTVMRSTPHADKHTFFGMGTSHADVMSKPNKFSVATIRREKCWILQSDPLIPMQFWCRTYRTFFHENLKKKNCGKTGGFSALKMDFTCVLTRLL